MGPALDGRRAHHGSHLGDPASRAGRIRSLLIAVDKRPVLAYDGVLLSNIKGKNILPFEPSRQGTRICTFFVSLLDWIVTAVHPEPGYAMGELAQP